MGILAYIVFGLIAGTVAKFLHSGSGSSGWVITILLGIAGSLVGRWLAGVFGIYVDGNFWSPMNWIISIGGAVLLLFIYSKMKK